MDVQANPHLHFGVNGGHGAARRRPCEDEALQFLSQEEQECILFFEETIDSLDDDIEEEGRQNLHSTGNGNPVDECDGPSTPVSAPSFSPSPPLSDRASGPKDQDIIDLVRTEPGPVQTKEQMFIPTMPDFQSMNVNPESHFEMKARRDPMENYHTEYNLPMPSPGEDSAPFGHALYHPVGSVPTPVLIAHKIAEHQGGGPINLRPSLLLSGRRRSLDYEISPTSPDPYIKQGPPTSAKPTRYPGNINLILGSKEHHSQSVANVNMQERKAQMLANLSGTSHPLEQEEPQMPQSSRNIPTRSVSFRDPTPDKSRMEALSKLGLTRNRALSGGTSLLNTPTPTSSTNTDTAASTKPPAATAPTPTPPPTPTPTPTLTPVSKPETLQVSNPNSYGGKTMQVNPSPPATVSPPEVSSLDFNSYGGKTMVVMPSGSSKSEAAVPASGYDSKALPVASSSDFNSYGGKSKVMTPAPMPSARSEPPDIISAHLGSKNKVMPPPASALAKSEALPYVRNSYGGMSRTVTSSTTPAYPSHSQVRPPRAPDPAPNPAPRPLRHKTPSSPHRVVAANRSPEPRRKSVSKPSFRSQGITVQFSGRGATDESRREALRKLGLLKETS